VTYSPSTSQILQARIAAALILGLIVLGALWYGVTVRHFDRLWDDIGPRRAWGG
jgi:hypothetical protein